MRNCYLVTRHNPTPSTKQQEMATKQQEFDQVLRNQGLTEEEIERFNTAVGPNEVSVFGDFTCVELFPGKHVSDIDLSFLSCKKRFRLLMLKYLAGELRDEQYNWLTAAEKYQLFLRGDVNFITMREAQMIASLMRKVEHRARLWMADNLSDEELAECEL
jgi:hypothetical protein